MLRKTRRGVASFISLILLIGIFSTYTAQAHHKHNNEEVYTSGEFKDRWDITSDGDNITVNITESIRGNSVVLTVEFTSYNQWRTYFSVDKDTAWYNGTNSKSFTVRKSEDGYVELEGIETKSLDGNRSREKAYLYCIIREWFGYGDYKKKYHEYDLSEAAKEKLGLIDEVNQDNDISILEIQPNHSFELSDDIFDDYDDSFEVTLTQMSMPEFISKVEDINGKYDVVYMGNKTVNGEGYSDIGDKYPSYVDLPQGGRSGLEYYSGVDITNRRAKKVKEFIESGQLMLFSSDMFKDRDLRDTKLYENFSSYKNFDNVRLLDDAPDYFSSSNNDSDNWKGRKNRRNRNDDNGYYNNHGNNGYGQYYNYGYYNNNRYNNSYSYGGNWGNNDSKKNGLRGYYYNLSSYFSTDWSWSYYATYRMSRIDSDINFDWGEGSPDASKVGNDRFLVRWIGKIRPEYSEEYTFYTSTDDGARLWLRKDDTYINLIDKWQDQTETEWQSEGIELEAGELYLIVMDYYENDGYATAKLKWSSSSQSKEIIPNERLYMPRYRDDEDQNTDDSSFLKDYGKVNVKPTLDLKIKPDSYQTEKMLSFGFDAQNNNSEGEMSARLYLDENGDGIFNSDEVVEELSNITSGTGYSVNHRVPESFTGLHPWKLELIDDATGTKNYKLGSTAFKGEPLKVRVLQLTPSWNTLPLDDLKNVNGLNLLEKEGEYEIEIVEMPVSQFDQNYPNPYNGNPTMLNGNYDMIIFGFADVYGGGNLIRQESINAVKDFINTGQSVMFTHDTMTFRVNDVDEWGYYLTKEFRDLIGQNIYLNEDKPHHNKESYGFTRLTLDRARYDQFFTTTSTYKMNDGLLTQYPYVLGDINVATTHFQYFQLDLEDEEIVPWYTLAGDRRLNKYDGRNDYYTYTKGNITYSGTGHSRPDTLDEFKLFVNTMIKASRGANHAPTLEVYGITDGQNITPSEEKINFTIKAEDIDEGDSNLTANIYINDSLVSNFEFEKGKQIPISIDNILTEETNEFSLKIVVNDSSKAEAVKEIKLSHLSIPTLSLEANALKGYLIGDTVDLSFSVNSEDPDKRSLISDILLETNIDPQSFEITGGQGWESSGSTKYGGKYFSTPTLEDNTRTISFKTLQEGEHQIESKLEYSALGEDVELDHYTLIDVKSGSIDIEVVDSINRGKEGVEIEIRKPDGSVIDIETNETGLYTINGLASGIYEITMDIPNGYSSDITNTKEITLSYDYNTQEVKFVLEGTPVSSVTRTLPEILNILESYEITYSVDGDTVVYNGGGIDSLDFKKFQYDETFPVGIEITEYPEGLEKTGSLEIGYRLQGNIDTIKMKKVDSQNNSYKVDGEFTIKFQSSKAALYSFNQGKVIYQDPLAIEGELIVDGGTVEIVDTDPPSMPVITASPTEATNQNVTVTITIDEEVDRIEYKLGDGEEWTAYTTSFEVTENTTVYARAMDASENASEIAELDISNIDKEAPSAPTIEASTTEITNQDVTVTITVDEEVDRIEYRLGSSGDWTEYTASFDVLENTTVYARAFDVAGNESETAELDIANIDKDAPSSPTIEASTTEPTNQDVTITITIDEEVDRIEYKLGSSGAWTEYAASFDVSENTTIYARAFDTAGNESEMTELDITNIDKEAPDAPVIEASPSEPTNGDVSITITAEENAQIVYKLEESGEWIEYTDTITLEDNYTIYTKATDLAGNVSEESEFSVDYIDKTTSDYEFISGEERQDSIFEVGRINSEFTFKVNEDIDKIVFKLDFISDNEDIENIVKILNSDLSINSDTYQSISYNEEDNTITIIGPLSAGMYEIEFPIEINYLNQASDTSFEIQVVQFKTDDNEEFTNIDSPQSINKINIKVIELPKLL